MIHHIFGPPPIDDLEGPILDDFDIPPYEEYNDEDDT